MAGAGRLGVSVGAMSIDGPLTGLSIIELGGIGPAPYAATLLAELGAEVVRIDRPGGSGFADESALHRSRPSLVIDLRTTGGVNLLRRLTDSADVLIDPFRPGVAERLGIGPDELCARNPRLVYARVTGWGQDGPWAQRAGHDLTYAALSGALHLSGTPDKPAPPVNLIADYAGGSLHLIIGILAALHERSRTGSGQIVDAAMVDGAACLVSLFYALFNAGSWRDQRGVNLLDGGAPFYDTYQCADDKWLAVAPLEPGFWAELNRILGVEFVLGQYDPAGFAEQRAAYTRIFRQRTRDEWAAIFEGSDACVAPVLSLSEAPTHPHLVARGVFADTAGGPMPRVAPRFSGHQVPDPGPPPQGGGDPTAYLLGRGFTPAEVTELLAGGAIIAT